MIRAAQILLGAVLLGAIVAASGCGKAVDATDSESHFLAFCTAGECGPGLSCVCGVCTETCSDDTACAALVSGSRCARLTGGGCESGNDLVCDVECNMDSDCAGLDGSYECVSTRCRARASGVASADSVEEDPIPTYSRLFGDLPRPEELVTLDESCCPAARISFGSGFQLLGCTFFRYGYSSGESGLDVEVECLSELPGCEASRGVRGVDIQRALLHPDMLELLDRENPSDQPVLGWKGGNVQATSRAFSVTYGNELFLRASVWQYDCSESITGQSPATECTPIPAGVRAFMELQDALFVQQLGLGSCTDLTSCLIQQGVPTDAICEL